MDGDQKAVVWLGAFAMVAFVSVIAGITAGSIHEDQAKNARIELILRSGDCKTLAAELAK